MTKEEREKILKLLAKDRNDYAEQCKKRIEAEKGKRYRISAIVKEHNEYQGVKQTILTRCKIVDKLDKEPEPKHVDSTEADKALDAFLRCCEGEASEEEFVNNLEGGKA